jgi:cysteine desulfurase
MKRIYLDYSATTPMDPTVLEAMSQYWSTRFGNASSVHSYGREARLALENSREAIGRAIGASYEEIYFTGGGTESDNHALSGVLRAVRRRGKSHLISSVIEHHAVLHSAGRLREDGADVTLVGVGGDGLVRPDQIQEAMRSETALISVMHANNETGVVQPIAEIGRIARAHGALFHSDAVQTLGKIPIDVKLLPVDLLSFSAHKIYGPKGIGAIYIRKGTTIDSFLVGGAQENNRRAGTESVPLAVGFAKALELCMSSMDSETRRIANLKKLLTTKVREAFPAIVLNGAESESLPNIVSVSFDSILQPLDGEALIMGMDLRGVAVTSGSACTSGSLQPSHVLLAMGRDEPTARATIRFSFGRFTTQEEIIVAVDALKEVVKTVSSA